MCVGVTITIASTLGIVDQRQRVGVRLRDVELFRHLLRQVADRIRHGDEPGLRNPARQVARIHPAETAETNHSYVRVVSIAESRRPLSPFPA